MSKHYYMVEVTSSDHRLSAGRRLGIQLARVLMLHFSEVRLWRLDKAQSDGVARMIATGKRVMYDDNKQPEQQADWPTDD